MTDLEIRKKVLELENWLIENPTSPDHALIASDLKKLQIILEENNDNRKNK